MPYACLAIPNLILQAILRFEPQLHSKPVAVVDGNSPLRVISASGKATALGIRPGITSTEATQIAPEIEIRRRSPAQEISAHAALLDAARSISPRVEDRAPGIVILDLSGLQSVWGGEEAIAIDLAKRAQAAGLDAQIAVASNPDTAIIAARTFSGICHIPPGTEAERLGPLPVTAIEACPDAGKDHRKGGEHSSTLQTSEILQTLSRWGIRTCGQLAALPLEALSERLGQPGVALQKLAQGRSIQDFVPTPASLDFTESMELDDAVAKLEPFAFVLGRLLHQLCARLGMYGLAAQELLLELALDPSGAPETVRLKDRENANPPNPCYRDTLRLAVPSSDVKSLLKLWRLRLENSPPGAPILKATLSAVPAKPRAAQGDLFAPTAPDPQKLEIVLARLRNLVGADRAGSPELLDSHRPDAFVMKSFSVHAAVQSSYSDAPRTASARPQVALRRFRPPLPVHMELRNGCPARIRFRNVSAAVTVASGPWRTRSDWWLANPCEIDEWDVEASCIRRHPASRPEFAASQPLKETSLYRLHFDCHSGQWLLAGIYD